MYHEKRDSTSLFVPVAESYFGQKKLIRLESFVEERIFHLKDM